MGEIYSSGDERFAFAEPERPPCFIPQRGVPGARSAEILKGWNIVMTDPVPVPPTDAPAEPLLTVGTITAAVTAALALLLAFGLKLTEDQRAAVLGVVAVIAPLAVAVVGRGKVFSPATVAKMIRRGV